MTPHSPLPHHASSTPAKAVLRVYRVPGGGWCVGRDGAAPEAVFKNRLPAIEFARLLGMAAGSYQIVFETSDGDVLEERYIPK